jgi:hypothetical protein
LALERGVEGRVKDIKEKAWKVEEVKLGFASSCLFHNTLLITI